MDLTIGESPLNNLRESPLNNRREHLRRIGRLGGQSKSEAKWAAARANCAKAGRSRSEAKVIAAQENGKRGGRPARVKTIAEVVAEAWTEFRKEHPEVV